jgi:hypothetical protein
MCCGVLWCAVVCCGVRRCAALSKSAVCGGCAHLELLAGMLGLGSVESFVEEPLLVKHFAAEKMIVQVSAGPLHSAALSSDGEVRVGWP